MLITVQNNYDTNGNRRDNTLVEFHHNNRLQGILLLRHSERDDITKTIFGCLLTIGLEFNVMHFATQLTTGTNIKLTPFTYNYVESRINYIADILSKKYKRID